MFQRTLRLTLATLFLSTLALCCAQGELPLGTGCSRTTYIEGCFQYSGSQQCSLCEYNYDLINGRCDYNPQPVEKCCLEFGGNGECSRCERGLFLDGGACKQATIPGCILKDSGKCSNCGDGFFLMNGDCKKGVNRCNSYDPSGACLGCCQGYSLNQGQCLQQSIPNCAAEQNGMCSQCIVPFQLISGQCGIPNCLNFNDFGCVICSSNFYLTQSGLCSPFQLGCRSYIHGACVDCLKHFSFNNGVCNMKGCLVPGINGNCQTCAQGYLLSGEGFCELPNCLHSIESKCMICAPGYHVSSGSCRPIASNCIDLVGQVCHSCAPGFFLNIDNHCTRVELGCSQYTQGLCIQCIPPFLISSNGKCLIDGCDVLATQGCNQCRPPYFLSNNICKMPNCDKGTNGVCSVCSYGYYLSNGQCVVDDINCQGYGPAGECRGCNAGYHFSSMNICVPNLPGCIYGGSTCSSCSSPFVFNSGSCSISNCNLLSSNGCSSCDSKYFLNPSFTCTIREVGCQYQNGVITGCMAPFTFNPSLSKCEIEGCTLYSSSGCATCLSPYKIAPQNICVIENCLRSSKGQCLECNTGFKLTAGLCVRSIVNCLEYNNNGCQTCGNLFYVSQDSNSCLPMSPGCIYTNGQCSSCRNPFSYNGFCYIEGCDSFDYTGCKTCKPSYKLDSGRCLLPNCQSISNGLCTACDDGFQASVGICKAKDQCLSFEANGTCKACSTGFSINICGRCVPTVTDCAFYGKDGKCSECISLRFLTQQNTCQVRDKGCKSYVGGVCTQCLDNFFLYDQICFPSTEGCLKYSGKDCVACNSSYTLSQGICLKASSKLSKGLDFGSDFCASGACGSTPSNHGTDIDFTNIQAKQPASGAKIGTLFYSSLQNSNYNAYTLNSKYGWKAGKNTSGEWAGIQIPSQQTFYEIQLQSGEAGAAITQFYIEFSLDGAKFDRIPGTFSPDCTGGKTASIKFTPVTAIAIRMVVVQFVIWPCSRFDFIYNNVEQRQDWAGLFSTNQINKKISSIQSSRLSNQLDINIRRFFNPATDCLDKERCWSGIELCEPKSVTAVNFPLVASGNGAISEFFIDYSLDGSYFSCYNNCSPISVTTTRYVLGTPLKAKNVRIHPTKWTGTPAVQFTFDYS